MVDVGSSSSAYRDVPAFIDQLDAAPGMAALCLKFLILTAARTSEVIGARWAEFDLEAALWTVPAGRMKAGKEHRVPLSPPAVALLRALPIEICDPEQVELEALQPEFRIGCALPPGELESAPKPAVKASRTASLAPARLRLIRASGLVSNSEFEDLIFAMTTESGNFA